MTPTPDSAEPRKHSTPFEYSPTLPQLPFKMLVLAELSPRDVQMGVSRVSGRISIDKDTFSTILEQLAGRVTLEVPNLLSETPQTFLVDIPLRSLKSFHPEVIAEQIPALKDLLQIRKLLLAAQERKISHAELLQQLAHLADNSEFLSHLQQRLSRSETPPSSRVPAQPSSTDQPVRTTKADPLDALLEMVDLPEQREIPSARRTVSLLDQVFSSIASSASSTSYADIRVLQTAINDLETTIGAQVRTVLHHPEFHRLETVWRGLKFLVDRTDFRANIQIEVLSTGKASLGQVFQEQVFEPEYEGIRGDPLSVIIADYEFDASLPDMDLLQEIAQKAEILQVPFLSSLGASFFGLETLEALVGSSMGRTRFEQPEYIKWYTLRQSEASRWITLACNRFLLRLPYGSAGERTPAFPFQEFSGREKPVYLWGNPVWAVASLLSASVAHIGWPTEITGIHRGGAIENLPVRTYQVREQEVALPLETVVSDQMERDLTDNGILVLTSPLNTDMALILSAPTVHKPTRYTDAATTAESRLRATLPYQLAASQIVHYVERLYRDIVSGNTLQGIKEDFCRALHRYLSTSGELSAEAIRVEITTSPEHPGVYELVLHLCPGQKVIGGQARIELRIPIR